jgi:enoyl-CoA hydratase/carnithine racemase
MPIVQWERGPDNLVVVTLDQPASRVNVLSQQLWSELEALLSTLRTQPALRGLVLRSAKPGVFVAGADIAELTTVPTQELAERGLRVLLGLLAVPGPTVALLDGITLGGGLELALACDYRLVGTHARTKLGLPEVKLAVIPGWGGTQWLPRQVGLELALELLTTGQSVSAVRAVEIGLATAQHPSAGLLAAGQEQIRRACACGDWVHVRERKLRPAGLLSAEQRARWQTRAASLSAAAQTAVRVVRAGAGRGLLEALPIETAAFVERVASAEAQAQCAAFFARRGKN